MEYKDYYAALGVPKTASAADIKKAYRKLVRKYHPDVSKEKDADARTKELNEAYGVLGDEEKRAAYDELGSGLGNGMGGAPRHGQPFRPPPDWGSGFESFAEGDSDFFKDLFAHVGGRRHSHQARGEDSHATIDIALRDVYEGATRTVSLRVPQQDESGRTITRERTLNVTIPKGMTEGQQLRLAGQGQPGSGNGGAGDLYLEIRFAPEPRYRVEGRDVYETVPVAPWEAALGAEIEVPTPSGRVMVAVPARTQGGRKLRLKGRGIPGAGSAPAGDLYLLLEVVLPPADTPAAKAFYEQMARALRFDPRAGLK